MVTEYLLPTELCKTNSSPCSFMEQKLLSSLHIYENSEVGTKNVPVTFFER